MTLNILKYYDLTNKFLSLTRWDVLPNGTLWPCFNLPFYGADTWIFASPIKKFDDTQFALGTWGCDGRIIYQAYKSNLLVLNPSRDIKCCHMHMSGIRHHDMVTPKNSMAWVRAGEITDKKADVIILQEQVK